MNTIRFAAALVFAVLASKACHSAMGQDAEFSVANGPPAGSTEQNSFLTEEPNEPARVRWPDQPKRTSPSTTASQAFGFGAGDRPFLSDPDPRFYFQVGALLFHQSPQFDRQPIVVDNNNNNTLLSTSDLDSTFNPGLQATVGTRLANGRVVEFDYMGLYGGSESSSAANQDPNSFLIFPNNLVGNVFVDMDRVQADYSTSFNSFALNALSGYGYDVKCGAGCSEMGCGKGGCSETGCSRDARGKRGCRDVRRESLSWFAGFRYIDFRDRLDLSAQRNVGGLIENGTYKTTTDNDLYGAQLGARWRRTSGRFGWDATGFGGIFYNDARQTQSVTDFPNFAIRPTVSDDKGDMAFAVGGSLSALYSLNSVWSLRTGYSVLWIEDLALAPDQLDFNFSAAQSGSQLHNDGGLLLHGLNSGLEARW